MALQLAHYVQPGTGVARVYVNGHGRNGASVWLELHRGTPVLCCWPRDIVDTAGTIWREACATFSLPLPCSPATWHEALRLADAPQLPNGSHRAAQTRYYRRRRPWRVWLGPDAEGWSRRLAEDPNLEALPDPNLSWLCSVTSNGGHQILRVDRLALTDLEGVEANRSAALLERWAKLGRYPGYGVLLLHATAPETGPVEAKRIAASGLLAEAVMVHNLRVAPLAASDDGLDLMLRMLKVLRDIPARARDAPERHDRDVARLRAVTGLPVTRAAALIHRFGSMHALAAASNDEIRRVPNIGAKTAQAVIDAITASGWRTLDPRRPRD